MRFKKIISALQGGSDRYLPISLIAFIIIGTPETGIKALGKVYPSLENLVPSPAIGITFAIFYFI